MTKFKRLQEELDNRIHNLGFQYLGLLPRFKYPDLEKIENLTTEDILNVGCIVEDILDIRELEKKLQGKSQEKARLRFERTTPLSILRESFLQYGYDNSQVKVHLSQSLPNRSDDRNNSTKFNCLKPFYPFLQFHSRDSRHPLLNKLYFSLNCLDSQYPINAKPVEFLGSNNIEYCIEDTIKNRGEIPTRKIGTF